MPFDSLDSPNQEYDANTGNLTPVEVDDASEKASPAESTAAAATRLAKLSPLDYERVRIDEANRLPAIQLVVSSSRKRGHVVVHDPSGNRDIYIRGSTVFAVFEALRSSGRVGVTQLDVFPMSTRLAGIIFHLKKAYRLNILSVPVVHNGKEYARYVLLSQTTIKSRP